MKEYLIFTFVSVLCYFLGIAVGLKINKQHCEDCKEIFIDVSDEEIQHVGYSQEQCGYDK